MHTQAEKKEAWSQQPPLQKKVHPFFHTNLATGRCLLPAVLMHMIGVYILLMSKYSCSREKLFLLLQDTAKLVFRPERKESRQLARWGFANFVPFILSTTLGDVLSCQHCKEEM